MPYITTNHYMSANALDIRFFKSSPIKKLCEMKHSVDRGRMPLSTIDWFRKEIVNATETSIEALAQEFFRLIIPNQPRTYTAINLALKTHYILSEEIIGYNVLPEGKQSQFSSGDYTGLGQITLTAAFLQEIDLKNGNIGINAQHQVIKIDGDWCFASLQDPKVYKKETLALTPELINDLPYPRNYAAHHWLDLRKSGKPHLTSTIVNPIQLSTASHFRAEINQAMLKILLLPRSYLRKFVDAFMPVGPIADTYIAFLQERQAQLKVCALQNASFQAYLPTLLALDEARKLFLHIRDFMVNGYYSVVSVYDHDELLRDFSILQYELKPVVPARPLPLTPPSEKTPLTRKVVPPKTVLLDTYDEPLRGYAWTVPPLVRIQHPFYAIKNSIKIEETEKDDLKTLTS